jgi:hypothetical protein
MNAPLGPQQRLPELSLSIRRNGGNDFPLKTAARSRVIVTLSPPRERLLMRAAQGVTGDSWNRRLSCKVWIRLMHLLALLEFGIEPERP